MMASMLSNRMTSLPAHQRAPLAAARCQPRRCLIRIRAAAEQTAEDTTLKALQNVTRRIKQLGRQGRPKEAIKELASLSKLGLQPDTTAATALVDACALRDIELAQSVFNELFGDFLQPDEVTFAVLLRGYGAQDPPAWQQIDATLTRMKVDFSIDPSIVCFNKLLEVCVRTNDMDRGLDVLDRMADDDVAPDDYTLEVVKRKRVLRSHISKLFEL